MWPLGRFPTWRGGHGEPVEIGETGVFRIRNRIVDLYAARVGNTAILFDTGMDPAGRPVRAVLAALGLAPTEVTDVFLTHAHPDHVAALPLLQRQARLHAGAGDAELLAHRARTRPAIRWFEWMFPTEPVDHIADPLWGRQEIRVGAERVLALPIPGDTWGSYAFLFRGVLIAGDGVEYRNGVLRPGPAYAADSPAAGVQSLRHLKRALAGEFVEWICTSHGGCSRSGEAPALLRAAAELAAPR